MRVLNVACACLMVAATAAAQNLLTNGSFDGGTTGWELAAMAGYDPTLDSTGTIGSGSLRAVATSHGGYTIALKCVAVTGSATYKGGGKVFIPSGQAATGYAKFGLFFNTSADCSTGYFNTITSPDVTATGSWVTSDTGFITAPATARSAAFDVGIVAEQGTSASATFQVNFDDLFLNGAAGASYSRWIPAVIHKDVPSKNAKWRSDVAVLNRSTSTANLTITMYPTSGPVSQTLQLGGSSQLLQTDIAGWLGVTADSGPLEVTSDQDFFLSGRTYNQVDATHTYGQDYEGQEPSELLAAGDSSTSTAWLPQLTENALYRTNIGITNTGTTTANVTVTLYDASGNQVWTNSRDYAAGGFYQYQQPYLALGGIASGYAKVTVNSGSGVVAYASVVDANTGDPTTITMKR